MNGYPRVRILAPRRPRTYQTSNLYSRHSKINSNSARLNNNLTHRTRQTRTFPHISQSMLWSSPAAWLQASRDAPTVRPARRLRHERILRQLWRLREPRLLWRTLRNLLCPEHAPVPDRRQQIELQRPQPGISHSSAVTSQKAPSGHSGSATLGRIQQSYQREVEE
jgi:hypothetical protein